jgi:ABC-2 type transport system permease protein
MSAAKPLAPSGARTLGTLIWGELIAFSRNWRSLILTVALPVLMLFLSTGKGARAVNGPAVLAACATALVTGTFALGLMGYGTVLAGYRERGIFQLLRCTPAPVSQLLVARLLVQLLAVLAEGVVVLAAAYVLFGILPAAAGIGLMFVLLVAAGLAALALGQAVAAFTKQAASTNAVSRLLLIALFVMEAMVGATRNWPDGLQTLANWTPVQLAQKLLATALVAGRVDAAGWGQLGALLAWAVVVGFLGLRWFRWEQE